MLELILGVAGLIAGLALLAYSGDKAVEHSVIIALEWGVPPLMMHACMLNPP